MQIHEFFRHSLLALPRERTTDDYEAFLLDWFSEYLSTLDEVEPDNSASAELKAGREVVRQLCERVRAAVHEYLRGFPARAYNELSKALASVVPWLRMLGTTSDVSQHMTHLYRLRTGTLAEYNRADLFHIPFQKRHLVASQRYSIPGLPSLYLGGSVWLCWEEMRRPAFEVVQISRFCAVPDSGLRVLDFGHRPEVMAQLVQLLSLSTDNATSNAGFVASHGICWPLFAACSVRVRYSGSPFVPEYIVPQLLLQWIRDESHFEGIRYFSTRVAQTQNDQDAQLIQGAVNAGANYVFPAAEHSATGQCSQLSSQFNLSAPVAWPVVENLPLVQDPPSGPPRWHLGSSESSVPYLTTSFYRVERRINAQPLRNVCSTL